MRFGSSWWAARGGECADTSATQKCYGLLTWITVGLVSIVSSFSLFCWMIQFSHFRATQWWPISAFQRSLVINISDTPIPPLSSKHYIRAHSTFFSRIGMPPPNLKQPTVRDVKWVDSSRTASRHREATTWILRFEVKQFHLEEFMQVCGYVVGARLRRLLAPHASTYITQAADYGS